MLYAGVPQNQQQQQPVYLQAGAGNVPGQPQYVTVQPGATAPMGGQQPVIFGAGPAAFPPDVTGIGKTAAEMNAEHWNNMIHSKMLEPQDMKPADEDPSRMYPVRELDGNWTQRNRFAIDMIGDCRWYVNDNGAFYAVRLPN